VPDSSPGSAAQSAPEAPQRSALSRKAPLVFFQDRAHGIGRCLAAERALARKHLVKNRSKSKNIGAMIRRLARTCSGAMYRRPKTCPGSVFTCAVIDSPPGPEASGRVNFANPKSRILIARRRSRRCSRASDRDAQCLCRAPPPALAPPAARNRSPYAIATARFATARASVVPSTTPKQYKENRSLPRCRKWKEMLG